MGLGEKAGVVAEITKQKKIKENIPEAAQNPGY